MSVVDGQTSSVDAPSGAAAPATSEASASTRAPNIAILIVTWNRWEMAAAVLRALSKQTFPIDRMDVVVIDNASTDGTTEQLRLAFSPEMLVTNPTSDAHLPAFRVPDERAGRNRLGFRSLTVVTNSGNHGGSSRSNPKSTNSGCRGWCYWLPHCICAGQSELLLNTSCCTRQSELHGWGLSLLLPFQDTCRVRQGHSG